MTSLAEVGIGKAKRGKGPKGRRDLVKTRRDLQALDKQRKQRPPKETEQPR